MKFLVSLLGQGWVEPGVNFTHLTHFGPFWALVDTSGSACGPSWHLGIQQGTFVADVEAPQATASRSVGARCGRWGDEEMDLFFFKNLKGMFALQRRCGYRNVKTPECVALARLSYGAAQFASAGKSELEIFMLYLSIILSDGLMSSIEECFLFRCFLWPMF